MYLYNKVIFTIFVTMIDLVYKTLLTIINKENQGYISPTEFNLLANNVQNEIFRGYFDDYTHAKYRESKGALGKTYASSTFNQRHLIQQFAVELAGLPILAGGVVDLPNDLYFIQKGGVLTSLNQPYPLRVIEEIEDGDLGYLGLSIAKPSTLYPVYRKYNDKIVIYPTTLTQIWLRYIRKPKTPNWTYFLLGGTEPMFNPANPSFQDFELHESEFSNIVLKMLSYFGINLREQEVVQIAEVLKDKMNLKSNS